MRLEKVIEIGNKKVIVKELRVKDLRNLLDRGEELANVPLKDLLKGNNYNAILHLFVCCTDLPPEHVEELSISEIKELVQAIMEVNKDFFDLLKVLGVAAIMTEES